MKICTRCEELKPLIEFGRDKKSKDELQPWCRSCKKEFDREYYFRNAEKVKVRRKSYVGTVEGYLNQTFHGMTQRCSKQKCYLSKGVKNKFVSSVEFFCYVVNILKVDPRGKEIHRKDNDGHYEPGNIEFLSKDGHRKLHWATSRRVG